MGTIIKASSSIFLDKIGSIDLSVQAANECLTTAGLAKTDVDLLIYASNYRDDNIMEPAISALIQKKLELNNDPVESGSLNKVTFSFDINNGHCGFLTSAQVADSMIKSGVYRNVLIVSADIHPSKVRPPDFPFSPCGTASLLCASEEPARGFQEFRFMNSGEGAGYVGYLDLAKSPNARETIYVEFEPDFRDRILAFTVSSVNEFIRSRNIDMAGIGCLVASQHFQGFAKKVADSIGMGSRAEVVDLYDEYGDLHSSSLVAGFVRVNSAGKLKRNDKVLFIASGAGLITNCALYVV